MPCFTWGKFPKWAGRPIWDMIEWPLYVCFDYSPGSIKRRTSDHHHPAPHPTHSRLHLCGLAFIWQFPQPEFHLFSSVNKNDQKPHSANGARESFHNSWKEMYWTVISWAKCQLCKSSIISLLIIWTSFWTNTLVADESTWLYMWCHITSWIWQPSQREPFMAECNPSFL